MQQENTFDKLVLLGCHKHWCWKLYCTTCGNMEFRNGMEMIGKRKDPLNDSETLSHGGLMWHDDPEKIANRTLVLGTQVAAANIAEYHRVHQSVDWLGFLGLALWRLETIKFPDQNFGPELRFHEKNRKLILQLISNSWCSQFYSLFRAFLNQHQGRHETDTAVDHALRNCKQLINSPETRIQTPDLTTMEGAVKEMNRYRRNDDA